MSGTSIIAQIFVPLRCKVYFYSNGLPNKVESLETDWSVIGLIVCAITEHLCCRKTVRCL